MSDKKTFISNNALKSFLFGVLVVCIATVALVWINQVKQNSKNVPLRKETSSARTTMIPAKSSEKEVVVTETLPNITPKYTNKNIYVVQRGDSLWDIALKQYHDGFKWVDIAKANNLSNQSILFSGMQLSLPARTDTVAQNNSSEGLPTAQKTKIAQNLNNKNDHKLSPKVTLMAQNDENNTNNQGIKKDMKNSNAIYTVQRGDTLWDISVKEYNNGFKWVDIAKANNLANPRVIHAGNVFTIPQNNNP